MAIKFSEKEVRQLAIVMHDNMCGADHTDGCGWGYEIGYYNKPNSTFAKSREGLWKEYAHSEWLCKARACIQKSPVTMRKALKSTKLLEERNRLINSLFYVEHSVEEDWRQERIKRQELRQKRIDKFLEKVKIGTTVKINNKLPIFPKENVGKVGKIEKFSNPGYAVVNIGGYRETLKFESLTILKK